MLIRVEAFSRILHIEWSKTEAQVQPPDNAPQPLVVYAEQPADPLYKLGPQWNEE